MCKKKPSKLSCDFMSKVLSVVVLYLIFPPEFLCIFLNFEEISNKSKVKKAGLC